MESFFTDLAKPFVERLINGAIAESRYICCFTCVDEEFKQEKVWLDGKRKTLGQHIEVATRKGEDVQRIARLWQEEADKLIQEADKLIQEDTKTKQKCFFGLCPHCIWRYTRGKELANKTEQIKRLMGEKIENVGLPAPLPDVDRYSSQHYIPFKSRELKYTELLDALKDDNNYITGLQGMGGTGKTTLAKEVGKKLKQFGQFAHVVDTTVSYTPDIKKIQDDIAGPLGLTLGDCNESDRPKKLWSRLTNGEKILLILDDVWGDINFDEIGIPYSDNHKGCRVLITTRNLWVCNKMGCGRTIQLELLTEEDAWVMFKRHAGLSDSSHKSLLDKGRKISNECKGLPVAIAAIASSLKGQKRREEWDMALKSLQKYVSMHDVDGDLVGIYKRLEFSYDYLKDEKAKGLFLLCSVFPEDEVISIQILTRLGIGAGLFAFGEDYYDDARNQVVAAKNKLLDSCLLLEAGEGWVKMHDLVRDAAQWIAKKEIRTVNLSHKHQKSLLEREKNIKYLLCEGKVMDVFFSRFGGFKLKILIAIFDMDKDHNCVEVPNSFFENIAGLRALHLNNKSRYRRQLALSLPQSIQSLTYIRSLLVDGIELGDISILGNLQSLEAIDLVLCEINELPHEITKLEKLRLLALQDCIIRRNNPFDVIRRCSSLEELYFEASFNSFCQEISFPKLHRYRVYRHLGWAIENKSLSKCVIFDGDDLSEATLKHCMQTAEALRLRRIKGGWRNLIPDIVPIDQGMTDLVELGLHGISQLQRLIDTIDSHVRNVLSKLVVLELWYMENLEELCNGPLSFGFLKSLEKLNIGSCQHLRSLFKGNLNLCNLKTMKLWECPMLVSLFQLSTSQSLVQLEELRITNCKRLENIIIDEKIEEEEESREEIVDGGNDNESRGSIFPKLKVLGICSCPQLEFLFWFPSARDLPVLGSLKEMHLHDLPNFIDIFPEHYRPMSSSVKGSSSTSSDYFKEQTQLDPIKCKKKSWTNICCYGHKFRHKSRSTTSTKLPFVSENQPYDCSIALELSGNVEHFLSLETLKIYNSKVESIFFFNETNGQQMNLGLQDIELQDLPVMTYLFVGPRNSLSLQNLIKIKIKRCEKLEIIFSTSIIRCLPQLLYLKIEECKELKHIIEDDVENRKMSTGLSSRTCFQKLQVLAVINCHKLKCVFPASTCKKIPELEFLVVREAGELEEIFESEDDKKWEIPNLKIVAFVNLPSLCQAQGIQFQAVKNRFVQNCQKLSLTSASTANVFYGIEDLLLPFKDIEMKHSLCSLFRQLSREESKTQDTKKPSAETTKDFPVEAVSRGDELTSSQTKTKQTAEAEHGFVENNVPAGLEIPSMPIPPTNSKKLMNEQSVGPQCLMNQQHPLDTTVKPFQGNNGIKTSDEEGTSLANAKTITSSTHSESVNPSSGPLVVTSEHKPSSHDDGDGQIAIPSCSIATTEPLTSENVATSDPVSLNDDASMKLSSINVEAQFPKDYEIGVSGPKPSPSTPSVAAASQSPSMPSQGDPSQVVEDLSTFSLVTWELEQLVSKKHLAYENLSLLTDFLVKHPFVRLADNSLSNRYKGYAYNCLAELLKFLQTHSVLDVLGSSHSEFVELLQDVRRLAFDKDWLDGVEKRALSPGLQVSQDASSEHELTFSQIKTKLTLAAEEHEFVEYVPGLEIESIATLPMNSEERLNEQSTGQQCQMNQQHPLEETDTTVKPSRCLKETEDQIIQEGSQSEKTVTTNLSTDLETRNELPIPLVAPKRKGTKRIVEEGTTSTNVKTITSSTHSETISSSSGPLVTFDERQTYSEEKGDGQIAIPSISLVNTKASATKDVDVGDSQESTDQSNASAMEDINQLIEEDPFLALEKLLTGKVSISSKPRKLVAQSETEVLTCSVGILLQELKTLMDLSSDPDHLVSREESKSKWISLFQQLNQHQDQGLLSSDIKDFVEKVQNFFSDHIVKHTTYQQVFNKHNQLLDSKTDLMNKLLSAKSTQTQIGNATSTANTQIHELSLQIDDLRKQLADLENQRDDLQLVVNNCDVQKKKLKAECTQWAQQSKELLSAIASSEIEVREAERARNLAKEGFANLKSSFPTF